MERSTFQLMNELACEPEALESTVDYLACQMQFLKKGEKVLLCFPDLLPNSIAELMGKAVQRCGAVPVYWEGDMRWKALLHLAFSSRASTLVGPPMLLLGIAKLARASGVPLYIRNLVTAGYPCQEWMIEGLRKTLDCNIWGCYGPGIGAVVSGFSCTKGKAFHLRDTDYAIEIVDEEGNVLPDGQTGRLILQSRKLPGVRLDVGEYAKVDSSPCACGCTSPRMMEISLDAGEYQEVVDLGTKLLSWTSILDCRLEKGSYGLEMELIIFPGEKLPKLPSCAKQIVRPWDPEKDIPFWYVPGWNKVRFFSDNH